MCGQLPRAAFFRAASEISESALLMHIFTYFVPSIAISMLLLRERIPHKYADVIPEILQRVCGQKTKFYILNGLPRKLAKSAHNQ